VSGRLSHERGISVPLVAIFASLGVFLIFGIGIDISSLNSASRQLSLETDAACKSAASQAFLQRAAAIAFKEHINAVISQNLVKGAVLQRAALTIPTMPQNGVFCHDGGAGCSPSDPYLPAVSGQKFVSLRGSAAAADLQCNIPCTAGEEAAHKCERDCRFFGTIQGDYYGVGGHYLPSTFWDNSHEAGVAALCETEAKLKTIMLGTRSITAKSTWWLPAQGKMEFDSSDPYRTSNGLTIAIAPHMTTYADASFPNSPRFNFTTTAGFNVKYDPLYEFGDAANDVNGFRFNYTSPVPKAPASVSGGATDRDLGEALAAPADVDRKELLVACMNPAILVRNLFLQAVLERASRHGGLRNATELLMVGTQNRVTTQNDAAHPLRERSAAPNQPIKMVGFGDDLLERRYQLPYVFYDSGSDTAGVPERNVNPKFGGSQGGWINPFQTADLETRKLHTLIANQLRYCDHLFHGGARGIERYLASGLDNDQFEPWNLPGGPGYFEDSYYADTTLRATHYDNTQAWDQSCPWSDDSNPLTAGVSNSADCDPNSVSSVGGRPLSAIELVSSIGSIQRCPYQMAINPDLTASPDFAATPYTCSKSADNDNTPGSEYLSAAKDLRPDILGLVLYLAEVDQAHIPAIPGNFYGFSPPAAPLNFLGLISPGLFPLKPNPSANPWAPFNAQGAVSAAALNQKSSILIVTHERMSRQERDTIKDLVNKNDATPGILDGRRVTIVYMPVRDEDCSEVHDASNDFKAAFGIGVASTNLRFGMNSLFVFSPYSEATHDSAEFGDPICTTDFNNQYSSYWAQLLDPTFADNIEVAARNIFTERLVHLDVKL